MLTSISLHNAGINLLNYKNEHMKNIMSLLIAGCITLAARTQGIANSKVPTSVKDSFAEDFPGSAAKWDMANLIMKRISVKMEKLCLHFITLMLTGRKPKLI